jgi:hypothetical protein
LPWRMSSTSSSMLLSATRHPLLNQDFKKPLAARKLSVMPLP